MADHFGQFTYGNWGQDPATTRSCTAFLDWGDDVGPVADQM